MTFRIVVGELPPRPTVLPKAKCGTCAYNSPAMREELEMMIQYYRERPEAHPCHERKGCFCVGSHEQVTELEKLVARRIENTDSEEKSK